MAERPSMTDGGIPPTVRRLEVIAVEYCIGRGVEGDPFRAATAIYTPEGQWLGTLPRGLPVTLNLEVQ